MGDSVLSGLRWGGAVSALWLMQQKDLVGALGCGEHFRVTDGVTSGSLPNTETEVPEHTLHEWWLARSVGTKAPCPEEIVGVNVMWLGTQGS